jgi:pilus assembly protein TadC
MSAAFAAGCLVAATCWLASLGARPRRRLRRLLPPQGATNRARRYRIAMLARPARRRNPVDPTALPAALDLLAACLSAGATLDHALASVADAFGGATGQLLGETGRLAALGAPPEQAWAAELDDPHWAPVGRAIVRAHYSGAALTEVLAKVADDRRRALRADAEVAAARASVRAVLPLGLCFLPAFVLVGVVPVVAGFIGSLTR